jgi:redox-sensitive bicupin YhaK (pirin superfamily)
MIELVVDTRTKNLGGFQVGRVLPADRRRMVGPFVLLDHAGPTVLAPGEGIDSRPHPHIGLSTITYLFAGEIVHRDNLGHTRTIHPGSVSWMTAGRGIVHSERSGDAVRASGGPLHGLQAWVALPERHEDDPPSFSHHPADAHPTFRDAGTWGRLVAGTAFGLTAPGNVHSPLVYLHWELRPGARTTPPDEHEERALLVVRGSIEVAGRPFGPGQLIVIAKRSRPIVSALGSATVVALGGAPLGERFLWWNLVSSRRERIEQAKADWAAGRMPLPPNDDQEWIPLPEHG